MKPQVITFRPMQGIWRATSGDSDTLANYLQRFNLIVDDKAQFIRFYDRENKRVIYYRADALKITLTIWKWNI